MTWPRGISTFGVLIIYILLVRLFTFRTNAHALVSKEGEAVEIPHPHLGGPRSRAHTSASLESPAGFGNH